jgi:DnaJ-class molecular chaperone
VKEYGKSVHGVALVKGNGDVALCLNCHGFAHELKKVRDPGSPVYALNLPRTCGTCHGDPDLAKRHGISITNAYELYMDSIHGRAVARSGLLVAANCSSCHGFHGIRPKEDPASKIHRMNIPITCGACHAGVLTEYSESIHGKAVREGKQAAPVCVDCHSAHQIARVETAAWRLEIISECGTCHGESLRTYRDSFHGQVTALGFTRVARCSDCHGFHQIFPASDPRSSISPSNRVVTCQKCHPKANENFVLFSPHADPKDKSRNPGLYYTAQFMNYLMIGVFAFFGLHTSLWLTRSMIEMGRARKSTGGLREEPDRGDEEGGDGPQDD